MIQNRNLLKSKKKKSSKRGTKEQNFMRPTENKDKMADVKTTISVIIEIQKDYHLHQKVEMVSLDTKQDPTIFCLQEKGFRFEDTNRLEAKG